MHTSCHSHFNVLAVKFRAVKLLDRDLNAACIVVGAWKENLRGYLFSEKR